MRIAIILFLFTISVNAQLTLAQLETLYQTELSGMKATGDLNKTLEDIAVRNNGSDQGWGYQSHYYQSQALYPVIAHWEASGSTTDFDYLKGRFDAYMNSAVLITAGDNAGYLGWPSDRECPGAAGSLDEKRCNGGTPLWEFFMARAWMRWLYDIHASTTLKASVEASYPGWFDDAIDFMNTNLFEKWAQNTDWGSGITYSALYRNRTHMAMEAAEFCLYLYHVNGNETALEIANNIMWEGMPERANDHFINKLSETGSPTRYTWNQTWNDAGTAIIQDFNHANHFAPSVIAAWYFDRSGYDDTMMAKWGQTLDYSFTNYATNTQYANLDGTGTDTSGSKAWVYLAAQFDAGLYTGLSNNADTNDEGVYVYAGSLYYAKYIEDNTRPTYPEHYQPIDGEFTGGSSSPPPVFSATARKKVAQAILIAH